MNMSDKMKVLVVGGNGFIGSHLVDKLVNIGWEVTVLDLYQRRYGPMPPKVRFIQGDFKESYLVREALIGIDIVFHLAWATIHEISNRDPVADVNANLVPSISLIQACQPAGVSKIVFVSSGGTVYGPAKELPIPETHPQNPITAYGITKLAIEKYLHMYHQLYGLDYLILRPSVPFGPRQNPLGKQGAVSVFLYHVAHDLPVTVWGDGGTTRDYFYVSDLVDALITGAGAISSNYRIFNIGGEQELSLLQLLKKVESVLGKPAIVDFRPPRPFDAQHIILDTTKAREHLNWQVNVPLTQGLQKTWEWISATIT